MTTINNLTRADKVSPGDVLPAYVQFDGDARGVSIGLLLDYIQKNLVFPYPTSRGPVVYKAASFTLDPAENLFACIETANMVVTLPSAALFPGRALTFKNLAAFTITSATANVVPLASTTPGTAILPATVGKYISLVSDGAFWVAMGGN